MYIYNVLDISNKLSFILLWEPHVRLMQCISDQSLSKRRKRKPDKSTFVFRTK